MPKIVEDRLRMEAQKKGLKGKRQDAYVYGTMNKLGMLHPKGKHGASKKQT